MANYSGIAKEETLKGLVRDDYFSDFGYEPNIDNIDFVITEKSARDDLFSGGPGSSRHYLWAEAKKGAMKVKAEDERYNALIKELRNNLSLLAEKIQPKVYEYGFLKE